MSESLTEKGVSDSRRLWFIRIYSGVTGDPDIATKSRPTTFEVWFGRASLPASCGSWPPDWHQSCSDRLIAGNGPLLGLYWHRAGPKGAKALAQASTSIRDAGGLGDAMRMARVLEAAHFDAVHALRDAKSLRLVVLKDDLAAIVAASPEAGETFDLALSPDDAPRLWIDIITAVVMEPGPKTYRLVEVPLAPARFCLKALTGPIWWTG